MKNCKSVSERFHESYNIDPSGCWIWKKCKNKGYGTLQVNGRAEGAHRVSYELFVGQLISELELDHLCRNPACVNPNHLEQVTHKENMRRGNGFDKQNARKIFCKHGHKFTLENTYMRTGGRRGCRKCNLIAVRAYSRRKAA